MTVATQPHTPTAPTAPNPDTAWFLDYLFEEDDGLICAGYIDGDPSIPKGQPGYVPLKEAWFHSRRQRRDALIWLAVHDQLGHNTYVRQCLFSKQSGCEANALPSRIIWQDDVTDPHKPCSVLIQTSERKYQALIRLDRPATTAERKRLATTWREESKNCEDDQNVSKDVAHHIRLPGGHNSKGHGWHPVTDAMRSERVYPADKLLARCGGETHPSSSSGGVSKARAEQHQADAWGNLPDGGPLLKSKRWQAVINGRPQLRQLLVERQRVIIYNKNGRADDSTSAQRAVFVQNLVTAWSEKNPGHIPENEIRAVAMFLKPMLGRGKTVEQYQVDIDCLIGLYRPKHYRPVATHCIPGKAQPAAVAALPASAPGPRGRPRATSQLDRLRAILQALPTDAAGAIRLDTKVIAAQLGKSPRQVRNYINDLENQREIKYIARGAGRSLAIFLTERFQTPKAPTTDQPAEREIKSPRDAFAQAPVLSVETPQTAHDGGTPHGETEIPVGKGVSPHVRAGAKNSFSLADAVVEAFDVYADRPLLPRKKGKPRRAPLTRRRIETYITGNYPALGFTDAELDTAIDKERFRRKLADIPHMTPRTLQAEIRHAEHLIDKSHEAGDQAWRWWVVYRNAARAELASRPPLPNRPKGGRKPCEAIPDPREVAAARQAEFWALADIALADMRGASHGQVDRVREGNHTGDRGRRAGARTAIQLASTAAQADSGGGGGDRTRPGSVPARAGEATATGAALTEGAAMRASLFASLQARRNARAE